MHGNSTTLQARALRSDGLAPAIRRVASLGAVGAALAGCAATSPMTAAAPSAACAIGGGAAGQRDAADTISIAALAPVDPVHAPAPTDDAERVVFAQLYRTLIDVDCERRAQPALARSWTLDDTRTRVTLTLGDDARFADGAPLRAANVLAAWRATAASTSDAAALAHRVADGTTVVDEHTLTVSLPDTGWLALADPALAVYRPRSAGGWPEGTGRYRVTPGRDGAPQFPVVLTPAASPPDPVLVVRPFPSGDPRDAIDAGVDVLVTDDPVAVAYAAAHAELTALPLPWTRSYALAIPRPGASVTPVPTDLASLARDAVRAEARPAEAPSWWNDVAACASPAPGPRSPAPARSTRIVYRHDDAVARGLAERLVALGRATAASGLAPDGFARALHDGADLGYVIALPRAPLSPCSALAALRSSAPWLAVGASAESTLIPLVETRARAIVKRDRVSATILSDGTLIFGGSAP